MFKNWQPGDWASLLAVITPILCASLGALWLTAKRLGRFETEHRQMKSTIAEVQAKQEKFGALDTAVQLVAQGMTTMQHAFVDLRNEIRSDRQESREALTEMRTETRDAISEVRHDVRNLLTGKVQPARRMGG